MTWGGNFFNQPGLSQRASEEMWKQQQRLGLRILPNIRICRRPVVGVTQWNGSMPGHYWIEFVHPDQNDQGPNGYRESFGWYPTGTAVTAIEGCVNADWPSRRKVDVKNRVKPEMYKSEREAGREKSNNDLSSRAFDPHQCDHHTSGKITYVHHPYLFANDSRTEKQVMEQIRNFAKAYKGKYSHDWDYKLDHWSENNCHTFVILLLWELNLAETHIGNGNDKHFNAYKRSAWTFQKAYPKAKAFLDKLNKVKGNCESLCNLLK